MPMRTAPLQVRRGAECVCAQQAEGSTAASRTICPQLPSVVLHATAVGPHAPCCRLPTSVCPLAHPTADIYTDLGDFEKAAQYYGACTAPHPLLAWMVPTALHSCMATGRGLHGRLHLGLRQASQLASQLCTEPASLTGLLPLMFLVADKYIKAMDDSVV